MAFVLLVFHHCHGELRQERFSARLGAWGCVALAGSSRECLVPCSQLFFPPL